MDGAKAVYHESAPERKKKIKISFENRRPNHHLTHHATYPITFLPHSALLLLSSSEPIFPATFSLAAQGRHVTGSVGVFVSWCVGHGAVAFAFMRLLVLCKGGGRIIRWGCGNGRGGSFGGAVMRGGVVACVPMVRLRVLRR